MTFLGPKKNFIKTIGDILCNEKISLADNYMLNIIKWFSILVLISTVITIIQENFKGTIIAKSVDQQHETILRRIGISDIVKSWGYPFKQDRLSANQLGKNNNKAVEIFDKVNWQ
jgi:hypothetical protein